MNNTQQLGPYHLVELLGEGAVGRVYLGEHRMLGVRHAIKVLRGDLIHHKGLIERFLREARYSARLRHPHIVQVVNADRDGDTFYIAMEYMRCRALDTYLEEGPLPPHFAVRATWQILQALGYAHGMGMVHRDIKPDNILVTEDSHVHLTDFGLVRALRGDQAKVLTGEWTPLGTPCFMSPEQWNNDGVDQRADIYGMGATLFYALSQHYPFDGARPLDIMLAQTHGRRASLHALCPALDAELVKVVHRAIHLDRDARFQTAQAFAEALEGWWARNPHPTLRLELAPTLRRASIVPISGAALATRRGADARVETAIAPPAEGSLATGRRPTSRPDARSAPHATRQPMTREQPVVQAPRPDHRRAASSAPQPRTHAMPDSHDHAVLLKPVEIAPRTYWVGRREPGSVFFANPYLRLFEGEDDQGRSRTYSILVDPGSSSDFAVVRSKVERLIGKLDRLSMLFINHQDPDVVSSATTLTNRFARRALIMTSRETWRLIVHGNLPRDRCVFTDHYPDGFNVLPDQRMIPVPSPFCHFVGAVMLYDPQTRVLFSGDLFGGLTSRDARGFLADESDWVGVRAFHQLYMPSNAAIRRTIQTLRRLDIEMIAPQHGRILRGAIMRDFMERLEHLEVGIDNLDERISEPETLPAWNVVMERVARTAISLGGPQILAPLSTDRFLKTDLTVDLAAQKVTIEHLGKSTLERAVDLLCQRLDDHMANIIKYEAILAAEEMQLPVPRITIEEIDENHVGADIPLDLAEASMHGQWNIHELE